MIPKECLRALRDVAYWSGFPLVEDPQARPANGPFIRLEQGTSSSRYNLDIVGKGQRRQALLTNVTRNELFNHLAVLQRLLQIVGQKRSDIRVDQYGDPIPPDLVILGSVGIHYLKKRGLSEIMANDWWEDLTGTIWVSLGQLSAELWEEMDNAEDAGVEEPQLLSLVGNVVKRYEVSRENPDYPFYTFYHA